MASSPASNADTLQTTHSTTSDRVTRYLCPFVFREPRYDRAKACDFVNNKHLGKEYVTKQRRLLGLAPVPTILEKLSASPVRYPTRCLFHLLRRFTLARSPPLHDAPITIVCLANTKGRQPDVPRGHVLLHVGSLTRTGTREEIQAQIDWLHSLPHRKKFVIAGPNDHSLAPWDQSTHNPPEPASSEKDNEKATKNGGNDKESSIEEDNNEQGVANEASNQEALKDSGNDTKFSIEQDSNGKCVANEAKNSRTASERGHKGEVISAHRTKDEGASERDNHEETVVSGDGSEKSAKHEDSSTDSISSGDISVSGPDWPVTEQEVQEAEQWAAAKRKGKQPVRADLGDVTETVIPDKVRVRIDSGTIVHLGFDATQAANTTQSQGLAHDTGKKQEPRTDHVNHTKGRSSEQDTSRELD